MPNLDQSNCTRLDPRYLERAIFFLSGRLARSIVYRIVLPPLNVCLNVFILQDVCPDSPTGKESPPVCKAEGAIACTSANSIGFVKLASWGTRTGGLWAPWDPDPRAVTGLGSGSSAIISLMESFIRAFISLLISSIKSSGVVEEGAGMATLNCRCSWFCCCCCCTVVGTHRWPMALSKSILGTHRCPSTLEITKSDRGSWLLLFLLLFLLLRILLFFSFSVFSVFFLSPWELGVQDWTRAAAQGICTTTEGILGAVGAVGAPVGDRSVERLLVSSLLSIIKLSIKIEKQIVKIEQQDIFSSKRIKFLELEIDKVLCVGAVSYIHRILGSLITWQASKDGPIRGLV